MNPYAVGGLILGLALTLAGTGSAQKLEMLKPIAQVKGSVADETLMGAAPKSEQLSKAQYEGLVKLWEIKDAPKVDFDKQIVLFGTTRGSVLNLRTNLDKQTGDLKVFSMATLDLRDGFRYVIVVVPAEGVKTINGKALLKDDEKK